MKKPATFLFVLFVLACTTEAFAQSFIVRGGLNLTKMMLKDNEDTYTSQYDWRPGFHLGATAEFPFAKMFAFETGLFLAAKGMNYHDSGDGWSETDKIALYYLDIPLNGKVYLNAGKIKVYGTLGPYVGIGLSGTNNWKYSESGYSDSNKESINWGSDPDKDDLKRMDVGATIGGGIELNSLVVGAYFSHGLANISANTDGGSKANNMVIGLTVGYKFGKK